MKRRRKITKRDQMVAAEILIQFAFVKDVKEMFKVWQDIFEEYGLFNDPFTSLPCTLDEYYENSLEYDRQTMIERYGHCDGLE